MKLLQSQNSGSFQDKLLSMRPNVVWVSIIATPFLTQFITVYYSLAHYLNYLLPLVFLLGTPIRRRYFYLILIVSTIILIEQLMRLQHQGLDLEVVKSFSPFKAETVLSFVQIFPFLIEPFRVALVVLIAALMSNLKGLEKAINVAIIALILVTLSWLASISMSFGLPYTKSDIAVLVVLIVLYCVFTKQNLSALQLGALLLMLLVLQSRSNLILGSFGVGYLFIITSEFDSKLKVYLGLFAGLFVCGGSYWFLADIFDRGFSFENRTLYMSCWSEFLASFHFFEELHESVRQCFIDAIVKTDHMVAYGVISHVSEY